MGVDVDSNPAVSAAPVSSLLVSFSNLGGETQRSITSSPIVASTSAAMALPTSQENLMPADPARLRRLATMGAGGLGRGLHPHVLSANALVMRPEAPRSISSLGPGIVNLSTELIGSTNSAAQVRQSTREESRVTSVASAPRSSARVEETSSAPHQERSMQTHMASFDQTPGMMTVNRVNPFFNLLSSLQVPGVGGSVPLSAAVAHLPSPSLPTEYARFMASHSPQTMANTMSRVIGFNFRIGLSPKFQYLAYYNS